MRLSRMTSASSSRARARRAMGDAALCLLPAKQLLPQSLTSTLPPRVQATHSNGHQPPAMSAAKRTKWLSSRTAERRVTAADHGGVRERRFSKQASALHLNRAGRSAASQVPLDRDCAFCNAVIAVLCSVCISVRFLRGVCIGCSNWCMERARCKERWSNLARVLKSEALKHNSQAWSTLLSPVRERRQCSLRLAEVHAKQNTACKQNTHPQTKHAREKMTQ